jgi:hypothetical protein
VSSVTLWWTNDSFATITPVTLLKSDSTTYSGVIPAQASSTSVRFYLEALAEQGGTTVFSPGGTNFFAYIQ